MKEEKKNPHAVALGKIGGQSGTGKSKRRTEQLKAYWASPASRSRWSQKRLTTHVGENP